MKSGSLHWKNTRRYWGNLMKRRIFAVVCLVSALLMSGCQISEKQRAEIEKEVRAELEDELREELKEEIREDILDELKKEGIIPENYGEKDSDNSSGGISFDFGMSDYVREARVTSACSTAASLKNTLDTCLIEFDTKGIGAYRDEVSYIGIEIENGVWNATIGNLGAFKNSGSYQWANDPNGNRAGDSSSGQYNPEILMEIKFADLFPELESGYVGAIMDRGRIMFLYFAVDTTYPVDEMERLIDSGSYDIGTYDWPKHNGVSAEGYIIGTSPMLAMAQ